MAFKVLLVCASALFVQAYSQILAGGMGGGLGWGGYNYGSNCGCGGVASTGGNFPAASASPAQPNGISVQSDNQYEGQLCLGGNLPFLGTVALEGVLPTQGSSQVSYGCGNGNIGITAEQGVNTGIASPGTYQPGPGALNCGCGYGRW